jgi:hypothetical protein
MAVTADAIVARMQESIAASKRHDKPYRHWLLDGCLPADAAKQIIDLPFPAPDLGGVSGKREVHNATRRYFDQENMGKYAVCKAFNEAFQDRRLTSAIERHFGTRLAGSYLRVEYAQDTDGFWLEPHTDLGVKLFTMLLYMSTEPSHSDLGTDIYDQDKQRVGRSPFAHNAAMIFVPSSITYHGFEKRRIEGVRKSVIINYVTNEWRAREQLAYPQRAVA